MKKDKCQTCAAIRQLLKEWTNKQGHDRCWYYPEIFDQIAVEIGIEGNIPAKSLPLREQFREQCQRYEAQQYETVEQPMAEYLKGNPCKGFKPSAYYQRHADWLDIHFKGVPSYQEDISDRIGVFRCMKTKEVVGVRVYGLSSVVGIDIKGILKLFLKG